MVRQNSSGLWNIGISALLVAAWSTPQLRLMTMFTSRRNPFFDVLPHIRYGPQESKETLRPWLESHTVTARSSPIPIIIIRFQPTNPL